MTTIILSCLATDYRVLILNLQSKITVLCNAFELLIDKDVDVC